MFSTTWRKNLLLAMVIMPRKLIFLVDVDRKISVVVAIKMFSVVLSDSWFAS